MKKKNTYHSSRQIARAIQAKVYGENVLRRNLTPLFTDIAKSFRVGDTQLHRDARIEIQSILRGTYTKVANHVLGIDYREHKAVQIPYNIYSSVSSAVDKKVSARAAQQAEYIGGTINTFIQKITAAAVVGTLTIPEATQALANRLNGYRLLIAVTEVQGAVETARRTAVLAVKDPLQGSVRYIADLIKTGDRETALALSEDLVAASKLPLSVSQSELIDEIGDVRDRLMTPYSQGQLISNLEERVEGTDLQTKRWIVSGYHTRESHWKAQADYFNNPIPIDEPFVLVGGLLQAPADASLGADLSEICNCRCATEYL